MLCSNQLDDLFVDFVLCISGAGERRVTAEILVVDGLHCHHAERIAHAVPRNHGAGELGCLLNVVGRAGRDFVENDFLCGTSAGEGGNFVFNFLFGHQIFVVLLHLHGVAEGTGSARNNGNFLYRRGVRLHRSDQGMADFMIGNNLLFVIGQHGVFLLITGDNNFDAFLQIRFRDNRTIVAHSAERRFVDDVCQLCTGCTGCHAGDGVIVDIVSGFDFLGVYLENRFSSGEIRQFYRNAAVKTARPRERRIQRFRTVCCCQNDDAVVSLKAVHFGEQLVERLFAFVIAADLSVALFADGVNLVDKDNARRFFLCLLEQVADFGGTHADKHLDKFRTGHREERHAGFACDSLCQHGFAGSRRADKQNALWHRGADGGIFVRIVQIIYDFL